MYTRTTFSTLYKKSNKMIKILRRDSNHPIIYFGRGQRPIIMLPLEIAKHQWVTERTKLSSKIQSLKWMLLPQHWQPLFQTDILFRSIPLTFMLAFCVWFLQKIFSILASYDAFRQNYFGSHYGNAVGGMVTDKEYVRLQE